MPANPRVEAAFKAMSALGIAKSEVKPVLKKLLKLYDKDWALIEEENYRVLADAIFEADENKVPNPEPKKKDKIVDEEVMENEEALMHLENTRTFKRLRKGQVSPSSSLKRPRFEDDTSRQQPQKTAGSSDVVDKGKGKQPVSPQIAPRGRRLIAESPSRSVPSKEPTVKPGMLLSPNKQMHSNHAFIIPKDEPIDEVPDYEVPIAVIPPEPSNVRGLTMKNGAAGKQFGHVNGASSQRRDEDVLPSTDKEATSSLEIASSTMGEVKISLSCSSPVGRPGFRMPSQDEFLKLMEDKCLRSYKITDPNFSVRKLLSDICDCMVEFRSESNGDSQSQEGCLVTSNVDMSKESEAQGTLCVGENKGLDMVSCPSDEPINVKSPAALVSPLGSFSLAHLNGLDDAVLASKKDGTNGFSEHDNGKELEKPISPNSRSLVVVPHPLTADEIRSFHDVNDLTKGEENVPISWVNETTNDFLPYFHYIPQNLVFREAYVNISLSSVRDEDCCSTCMGNCVLSSPCACTKKTGGEFAYNAEGLLKEEFLEECIAISRNPQQHYFYCNDCPLERSKNDGCIEPCKGHLKRKFIKECWSKCGCGKQCGNRVVQRGITCNLQVFLTSEGKGWGLRTLEDLPKGAFVCEFVGEILTMKELHERNVECAENGHYVYPVLLDADWDSGYVKDEEALCLDAASFGNAARFINHRCSDANLVELPVKAEGPDHHYYHFALFTSRKVAAQEELTWDYGIDFDDHDHPVKLFQCRCGSKFCRNMKRSNRSLRSASNA